MYAIILKEKLYVFEKKKDVKKFISYDICISTETPEDGTESLNR